jgi:hypothetical protein
MLLVNICPKCGRQYPATEKTCLECGTALVSRYPAIPKKTVKKTVRYAAYIAVIGIAICAVWFAIIPLLQYSVKTGNEFSKTIGSNPANASMELPRYAINQPVKNDKFQVTVTRIREGSNVMNTNRFYYVTVALQNLRPDATIQISATDFTLVDKDENLYYTYGIGDKVTQDLGPLQGQSYELQFVIPREAQRLTLQFYSPEEAGGIRSEPVLFALS